ncbi:LytR/AlgR family response regulator transcription factor [Floccifex sp.]|uniref:LytR/AlgR family response regulator transcription factor n=1 Tax=Floccifex sp. TaxID=2815810 RepID=UPI003EFBBE20
MNFLICEDNPLDVFRLKTLLESVLQEMKFDYCIDVCSNRKDLFSNILKYDFLFLDIELGNDNGIELGIQIKEKYPELHIILTSAFKKYLEDGYKTKADRFFVKPIQESLFKIEMKDLLLSYYKEDPTFYDPKVSNVRIPFRNIVYIEYIDRYTYLHLNNGKILKTRYKMYEWIDMVVNLSFSQSYKSILINLKYVKEILNHDVILETGMKLPVSKHYRKEFESKWKECIAL